MSGAGVRPSRSRVREMNSLQDRRRQDEAPAHVVAPAAAPDGDRVTACSLLGPDTGFAALAQTLLACAPGRALARGTGDCEEVLFVLSGEGVLRAGGEAHALAPESGAYLAPGESYELEAHGPEPLRLVAVTVPDPEGGASAGDERAVVRRLADQERAAATTQREFRIVADPDSGLRSATHFVGYIPTLRAPEHFHTYDEVIYVLDGEGVMHVDGSDRDLTAGSSIQLPARTVHCLENTGDSVMRIVAVFRPAGSPAAAYYPDGTPAYTPTRGET
jgi:quercetin dioxygenase-like cupin family protein